MLRSVIKPLSFRGTPIRRFSSHTLKDLEAKVKDLEAKVKDQEANMEHLVGVSFGLILGVLYLAGTKKGRNN